MTGESGDKIRDYMSSPVASIHSGATIQEVARIIKAKNVSAILITENNTYIGIVTERDFTRKAAAAGLDAKTTPVSAIMSQPLNTIDQNLHILQANEVMTDKHVRHITVTDNGKVVGMLSSRDMRLQMKWDLEKRRENPGKCGKAREIKGFRERAENFNLKSFANRKSPNLMVFRI